MLEILYHDEHLVAVNKPSGLLVHKSPIDKGETQFALQMVRQQFDCHRLLLHAHKIDFEHPIIYNFS